MPEPAVWLAALFCVAQKLKMSSLCPLIRALAGAATGPLHISEKYLESRLIGKFAKIMRQLFQLGGQGRFQGGKRLAQHWIAGQVGSFKHIRLQIV